MEKKVQRVDENKPAQSVSEKKEVSHPAAPKTEADKIWDEIKDKKIDMFSLPSQVVSQYCKFTIVEPSKAYLIVSATSVLPALETALGDAYVVDRIERFVTVARKR